MEDNSAYLIPYSKCGHANPDCWDKHIETDDERLKRFYLKSAAEVVPDEDFQALNQLFFELTNTYISGLQIDPRVPYWVREI